MRGIEAGSPRGQWGAGGRDGDGRVDRAALERAGRAPQRGEGLGRGRAFAAFADAIASRLRGAAVDASQAANGARPGVGAVALALRDALVADPSDTAVAALLNKVDSALAGAVNALGLEGEAAQREVAAFREDLAARVGALAANPPTAAATNTPTSDVASASYRVVQKTGIELLTQEGDVVRISLRTKEGFRAAGGYSPTAAYLQVASYSKTRFTVEVQGSLSAEERAAIDDVLSQVDAIAADFYAGDTASAFAAGAALDVDASQLAAVSLRMSQATSLRLAARAEWSGAPPTSAPPVTVPLPGDVPQPTPPVAPPVATDAPVETAATAGGPSDATPAATDASSTPAPTDTVPAPAPTSPAAADATARSSVLQTMTDYLVKLFDSLGATSVSGRLEFSARAKLQLVIAAVDVARLPGATTEATASQLLGNVVAATEDRPTA